MMLRSDVDAIRRGTVNELVIGCNGCAVAVMMSMRMIVAATRHRRQMMVAAERAIRNKGKRRHHRQSGGNASAHRSGKTDHQCTE